jgi:uncharacterized cupin superfamily protein
MTPKLRAVSFRRLHVRTLTFWREHLVPGSVVLLQSSIADDLKWAPIRADWIVDGEPQARRSVLAKSQDRTSYMMSWECTPGRFNWHYPQDETVVIVSGEVFIAADGKGERRLGPGDFAFFPAGTSATWRVTATVRKIAHLREPIAFPLVLLMLGWRRVKTLVARLAPAQWIPSRLSLGSDQV